MYEECPRDERAYGEFVVAARSRGIRGIVVPIDVLRVICRLVDELAPRLQCRVCRCVVLADRETLWATRQQHIEWYVCERGFLVDSARGTWRLPCDHSAKEGFVLCKSPCVVDGATPIAFTAEGRVYENRAPSMVQLAPYFLDGDDVYCVYCRFDRFRLRLAWRVLRRMSA